MALLLLSLPFLMAIVTVVALCARSRRRCRREARAQIARRRVASRPMSGMERTQMLSLAELRGLADG